MRRRNTGAFVVGNDYTATGQILLGLKPTSGEVFTPLINIDASLASGSVAFTLGTPTPRLTVTNASFLALGGQDVWISDTGGIDSLDFDQTGAGIKVDLGRRGPQRIDALENVIRLDGRIENATGSDFADVLIGNEDDNLLRGGAGDDELRGDRSNDILIGEAGYDFLSGDRDRDLLIGGSEADVLCGEESDDILIAGLTAFDGQNGALSAILAEWTSNRGFDEPARNLTDGTGSPTSLNGDYYLNQATIFNDFVPDTLLGGPGRDWFLGSVDSMIA